MYHKHLSFHSSTLHLQMRNTLFQNTVKKGEAWKHEFMYAILFNGYHFSCKKFGHRALECNSYAITDHVNTRKMIRLWRCNHFGHTARFYYTIGHYMWNTCGHKPQTCKKLGFLLVRENSHTRPKRNPNKVWRRKD